MQDERTLAMKKNFMALHKDGKAIKEIAEMYDLTTRTIYNCLGEIAEANGVSRESLLERPHSEHAICKKNGNLKKVEPVDGSQMLDLFEKTINEMTELHKQIKETMKKIKRNVEKEEEIWEEALNSYKQEM